VIRQLGPQDWTQLRDVRLQSLAESPSAFGSTYAREAAFDEAEWRHRAADNGWFLATGNGSPIGIVAGRHDPESPPQRRYLIAMWVVPQARGSGVAADLVGAVVTWARADGADELTLGVADGNDRARALYVNLGFVATGETYPLESDPGRNIEILRLAL
jgi:RimJ/RimL family protein N-acetyltransferase